MVTLKDICDLEYQIFNVLLEKWIHFNIERNSRIKHPINRLKDLYTTVGFFKEDYLELLPPYRQHLDSEFVAYQKKFTHLSKNYEELDENCLWEDVNMFYSSDQLNIGCAYCKQTNFANITELQNHWNTDCDQKCVESCKCKKCCANYCFSFFEENVYTEYYNALNFMKESFFTFFKNGNRHLFDPKQRCI